MMKKKIVCIFALLFALMGTACDDMPTEEKNPDTFDETEVMLEETLSSEELEKLHEKIGENDSDDTQPSKETSTDALTESDPESTDTASNPSARTFMTGIWLARTSDGMERYFVFSDPQNGHYLEQETGMGMGFTYEMQDDETAIFHFGDVDSSDKAYISWVSMSNAYVKWESGEIETFKVLNGNPTAELKFYSNNDLCEMASNYYQSKEGFRPSNVFAMVDSSENIFIQLRDDNSVLDSYTVDRYTAIGKDILNQPVDLSTFSTKSDSSGSAETNVPNATTTAETTATEIATTAVPTEEPPQQEEPPQEIPQEEAPPEEIPQEEAPQEEAPPEENPEE